MVWLMLVKTAEEVLTHLDANDASLNHNTGVISSIVYPWRPCALCVLLRTLCDRINRIGEIGYYLASFEAAISHIQELDLTEEREELLSFLSVPLDDD
jgi:hypothetical protein